MTSLKAFFSDQSGAISTEWLVLTAAIVTLSLAAVGYVVTGTEAVAEEVSEAIEAAAPQGQTEVALSSTIEGHTN